MIALLLQVVQPPAAPPSGADVIVTAERLRRLRLALALRENKLSGCEVKVSSGDARIDAVACEAAGTCVVDGTTQPEPMADCINTRITQFVDKRAAQAATSR